MSSKISTDLFNNYYNNPSAIYVDSGVICSGAASANDITFDFNDDGGDISNKLNVLSHFDLSDIHEPVKQWNTNSKILGPKSIEYIQGLEYGASYQMDSYIIPDELYGIPNFEYFVNLKFTLNYLQNFKPINLNIETNVNYQNKLNFVNYINNLLLEMNVPIEVTIDDQLIKFTSTQLGFKFSIDDNIIGTTIDYNTDPYSPFIESYQYTFYKSCDSVFPFKYPNGAFKGILVKVTYPKFNDDAIAGYQRSLKINHIRDYIYVYKPISECSSDGTISVNDSLYEKIKFDIIGSYVNPEEINNNGWIEGGIYFTNSAMNLGSSNVNSNNSDNGWISAIGTNYNTNTWISGVANYENQLGLYGYLKWVEANDMWTNIGPFYSIITSDDSPNNNIKNFANSLIIFNPNDFPVKIDYLIFV